MARRWRHTAALAGGLATVMFGAVAPAQAVVVPALAVDPPTVAPGEQVQFFGVGFDLPQPGSCEIVLDTEVLATSCVIDGHVFGSIDLQLVEDVEYGVFTVTVCVPSCDDDWAGRASGALAIEFVEGRVAEELATAVPAVEVPAEPFRIAPNPAQAGDQVIVEVASLPAVSPGCVALWGGLEAAEYSCSADAQGLAMGVVTVPATAKDGVHSLGVCRPDCASAVAQTATAPVWVMLPPAPVTPPPVTPPAVTTTPLVTTSPPGTPTPTPTASDTAPIGMSDAGPNERAGWRIVALALGAVGLSILAVLVVRAYVLTSPPRPITTPPSPALRVVGAERLAVSTRVEHTTVPSSVLRVRVWGDHDPTIAVEG